MAEIFIRDYEDDFWGDLNVIGMGNNHSSVIIPKIENAVRHGVEEITVNINTLGGSVYCSLSIKNALQKAKEAGVKIITINEGICASAGTPIFMEGDERITYTSLFMVHNPSLFIFDNMTVEDLEREKNALQIVTDTLLTTYKATGLDDATLTQMLNAETWLTPALCLSLGFATEDRSSPENKANVLEQSMKALEKASPENRIYANKYFNTIKSTNNSNMENVKETLKQSNETIKKNNDLLNQLGTYFKNIFTPTNEEEHVVVNSSVQLENESYIHFDGTLEVGTKVYANEEMTEPAMDGDHTLMDGRTITVAGGEVTNIQDVVAEDEVENSALITENQSLKDEVAQLKGNITNLTNAVNKSNDLLAKINNVKSTYKPENREQEFTSKGVEGKPDLSKEAREARKQEIQDKKNKK